MKPNIRKTIALTLALVLALSGLAANAFANDTTIEITTPKNNVPIAENLNLTTYKGVSITGRFKALDPDGDMLTFEVTSEAKKGSVTISDSCEFVYSPNEKSKGKDEFTYVAVDANGGVSATAKVTINIKKQSGKMTYADMDGNSAHYASLVLAEKGIFSGESLGGESFFRPDAIVTRGEFLAMCLAMTETDTLDGITRTGFADDNEIPGWMKPYISAALLNGIVGGYRNSEGRLVFSSNAPITFTEAAVIIDRALGLSDVISVAAVESDVIPAWAQSAAVNVVSCNILPSGLAEVATSRLTRADAALMLQRSIEVLEARSTGGGLLGWAK